MPEYIYLLENRLSSAQQEALKQVRDAAREAGMTVFLAGGAVRDLTTGSSVRNLDFAVQGNALTLKEALVGRGGEFWGAHEPTRTLSFWFAGSVRVQVASARSEEYPKPGKPVYTWSTIVEDLRRRDFTANAMALSLNEGSYGLLLDPLNGVADIEARLLRLAGNYGFLEDPSRMIRAIRLQNRLGWQMDDKTASRYQNAKEAEAIKVLSPFLRGYELERIASEEDALVILKALEAEGWMEHLLPTWTSAKADIAGLESLRRNWIQLLMQGVTADLTSAQLELLTAKMTPAEVASLKKALVHPGLVAQWEALDESAKEFGRQLTGKAAATPSASWKMLTTQPAEPILWLAHTRKAGAVDTKFKNFFTVWPEFKKKVPAALMLEMRITPELPGYADLLEQLFYQLIDGNLETDEAMRAFLEPWSPPAPPPPPTVRRSRAKKSESKAKRRAVAPDDEEEEGDDEDEDDAEVDLDSDADPDVDSDVEPGPADLPLDVDVDEDEEDDAEADSFAGAAAGPDPSSAKAGSFDAEEEEDAVAEEENPVVVKTQGVKASAATLVGETASAPLRTEAVSAAAAPRKAKPVKAVAPSAKAPAARQKAAPPVKTKSKASAPVPAKAAAPVKSASSGKPKARPVVVAKPQKPIAATKPTSRGSVAKAAPSSAHGAKAKTAVKGASSAKPAKAKSAPPPPKPLKKKAAPLPSKKAAPAAAKAKKAPQKSGKKR